MALLREEWKEEPTEIYAANEEGWNKPFTQEERNDLRYLIDIADRHRPYSRHMDQDEEWATIHQELLQKRDRVAEYLFELMAEAQDPDDFYSFTQILTHVVTPAHVHALTALLHSPYVADDADRSSCGVILEMLADLGDSTAIPELEAFATRTANSSLQFRRYTVEDVIDTIRKIGGRIPEAERVHALDSVARIGRNIPEFVPAIEPTSYMEPAEPSELAVDEYKRTLRIDELAPDELPPGYEHADACVTLIHEFLLRPEIVASIEETALPALKLHMFNYMLKHPDTSMDEFEREFTKVNRLSEMERDFGGEDNPLPTIGIEIELPKEQLNVPRTAVLNSLGIPNVTALDMHDRLWEVNPSFSYSPWVQARVLQELADMGAVPLDAQTPKRVTPHESFSLHVNFGLPGTLEAHVFEDEKSAFLLLNDCLTYAFVGADRLQNRKTRKAIYLNKGATKTKKTKGKDKMEAEPPAYRGVWEDDEDDDPHGPKRAELRVMEFRDYPTFRMLAESQKLMAMLSAHLEVVHTGKTDAMSQALDNLWKNFAQEVGGYFAELGLTPSMMDGVAGQYTVVDALGATDLKGRCRTIVHRYAAQVTQVIADIKSE